MPGTFPVFVNIDADFYFIPGFGFSGADLKTAVFKTGIGKPVPEGEQRLHVFRVVMAVADEDALAVNHLIVSAGVVGKGGVIL